MTVLEAPPSPRPIDYPEEWPPGSGVRGPNRRQLLAHQLEPYADEVLYGGARGGGKTDWALAAAIRCCAAVAGFEAVFFRRTYKELSGPGGAIPRLLLRLPRAVARYNSTEHKWTFWNGSTLTLSYLDSLADVQAWLGLEIQLMVFDQVEQLDEETYVMVRTSLRVTGEKAAKMRELGLRPRAIATANPGGRGHVWVKRRFIDPFPLGGQLFRAAPSELEPSPMVRVYVPARLDDNPALAEGDPTYRARLEALGAEDRAAQLEGDWDVFKGARFADFRTRLHVVTPEHMAEMLPPPGTAPRAVGCDYGNEAPHVALWGCSIGDGLVLVYRELWARGVAPGDQARAILAAEAPGERTGRSPIPVALDPACWAASPDKPLPRTGGKVVRPSGPPVGSIAWHYQEQGLPVERADNRRLEGASDVAARLQIRSDGMPRILISEECTQLIETLPSLMRDKRRPEDVEKGPTDHWYDALRYLLGLLGYLAPPAAGAPPEGRAPRRLPVHQADIAPPKRLPTGVVLPSGTSVRGLRGKGF